MFETRCPISLRIPSLPSLIPTDFCAASKISMARSCPSFPLLTFLRISHNASMPILMILSGVGQFSIRCRTLFVFRFHKNYGLDFQSVVFLLEELPTRLNHVSVKENVPIDIDFLERFVQAMGGPVRTVRGHRLHNIGHCEDSRL